MSSEKRDIIVSMLPTDSSYPALSPKLSRSKGTRWLLAGAIASTMSWGLFSPSFVSTTGLSKGIDGNSAFKEGPISWYDCGPDLTGYKCADVAVPLDYLHPARGNASVAMIVYPTQAQDRQGSIFTNPGGPGGSGTSFISRIGPELQLLTGGKHDIIGFDPRGIGKTKPRFRCFTNQTEEDLYAIRAKPYRSVWPHGNLSEPANIAELEKQLAKVDAQDEVIGGACLDPEGAGPYMSTAHVVRDIEYLSTLLDGPNAPINYWGFSYGTTVGTYLTAMFPDRVGKVVIDAVMAVESWYSQPHIDTSAELYLVGFEDSWEVFLDECAKAGPGRCALATSTSSAAAEISQNVEDLLEALYKRPLPVIKSSKPGLLIRGHVLDQIRTFMYKPRNWGLLAQQLFEAMNGNGSAIYEAQTPEVQLNSTIESDTRWAGNRVGCSDEVPWHVAKEDRVPLMLKQTITDVKEYTRHFAGGLMEVCWNWNSTTSERFAGPLHSKLSNPMLIIGNKHDSICPLFNAKRIHDQIKDSRLIVQNSPGHCSIAFTSLCTIKAIQSYFVNNTLFDDTLVCEPDEMLFPSSDAVRFGSGQAEKIAEIMGKVMESQLESM